MALDSHAEAERAEHIGVSTTTVVRRLIPAGLPHTRIGSRYVFLAEDVDEWLRNQPGDTIDRTLERLHAEWEAGGGTIDDRTAARIADALRPARQRRLEAERHSREAS